MVNREQLSKGPEVQAPVIAQETIASLTSQYKGLNLGNEAQHIIDRALQTLPPHATRSQVEQSVVQQVVDFLSKTNPSLAVQVGFVVDAKGNADVAHAPFPREKLIEDLMDQAMHSSGGTTESQVQQIIGLLPAVVEGNMLGKVEQFIGFLSAEGSRVDPALIDQLRAKLPPSAVSKEGDENTSVKEVQFGVFHPIKAQHIGKAKLDPQHKTIKSEDNISTLSTRFSVRTGLDDSNPEKTLGTQVNAMRHAIWQTTITSQYGTATANDVGNVHENNPGMIRSISPNTTFATPELADQATDLMNNVIGRYIGSDKDNANLSPKELTLKVLDYFHDTGLWMALQTEDGYKIAKTKLPDADYIKAKNEIGKLDDKGLFALESFALQRIPSIANQFHLNIGGSETQEILDNIPTQQLENSDRMTESQMDAIVAQQVANLYKKKDPELAAKIMQVPSKSLGE